MACGGSEPEVAGLVRWLVDEGRFAPDTGELLRLLSERLVALGVPLARATTHIRTLHPEFRGIMRLWRPGQTTEEITPRHGIEVHLAYQNSPLQYVSERREWLDRRTDDPEAADLPMLAELRREGITHYVMAPMIFSDGAVNAVSWATGAPGGFSGRDLRLLRAAAGPLELILEAKALRRISSELLATYVGRDPANRIIAGAVQRGDVERIRAAILLTDLRGFTALADALPGERVIDLVNLYFDCVVPAVAAEGGEVLKFIGDGVLSVFRVDGGSARTACTAALRAARAALDTLAEARRSDPLGGVPLHMGVALHYGEIAYGNVGSGSRLDFTAIGRDVNFVERLERLCGPIERPLLMSAEFAAMLGDAVFEIGHFDFRGFRQRRAVFGLVEDGA